MDNSDSSSRPFRPSDNPMMLWLEEREDYLQEELASDGRRGVTLCCRQKHKIDVASGNMVLVPCSVKAEYRCMDCDGDALYCAECIVTIHETGVLHRLQKWTVVAASNESDRDSDQDSDDSDEVANSANFTNDNGYFVNVTLSDLGYRVQLGHPPGTRCPLPFPSPHGIFTVMDVTGIHDLLLDFCGCNEGELDHGIQIRRFGWFPATVRSPRSAATIRLLKLFQLVTFESKASTQDFYQAIKRCTDNSGLRAVRNLYPAFLNMTRQFGHLKMLKRAGRGNHPTGAMGTQEGELALLCPACPQPGLNLPNGWEISAMWFLYILMIGIDANFRLRRKMISNRVKDPALSKGTAYFADDDPLLEFVASEAAKVEQTKSTCSNHDAVNKHREGKGLAATGVAAVDCIRHDFKRPISVVDLQKGERYCNIDYAFCSSLRGVGVKNLAVSYDIVCQWKVNLPTRILTYPPWMKFDEEGLGEMSMRFLVPKFHLPAHILSCQTAYSFNFHQYVGRTDGEGVERAWSAMNQLAGSTREMGPGARQDTLNNHMGDRNWKKTCTLVLLFRKRIRTAVPMAAETRQDIDQFSESLALHHGRDLVEWRKLLDAWQVSPGDTLNPFQPTQKAPSFNNVRVRLAQEEARDIIKGVTTMMNETTSASQLISMGIELESRQRKLVSLRQSAAKTDSSQASLHSKSNRLLSQIENWIKIQEVYTPSLHAHRSSYWDDWRERVSGLGKTAEIRPEAIPLLLPSSKAPNVPYDPRLMQLEWELRHGQAVDALDSARDAIRLKSYVTGDKIKFQFGQRANTRSNGILDRLERRKQASKLTYIAARNALISLAPNLGILEVDKLYPELTDFDLLPLRFDPSLQRPGEGLTTEGQRRIPWIWTHFSIGKGAPGGDDTLLSENLRIEWCRGVARAERWEEEILLLMEEQRRVVAFFEARAGQWDVRAQDGTSWSLANALSSGSGEYFSEGRRAYAHKQAVLYRNLAVKSRQLWIGVADYVDSKGSTPLARVSELPGFVDDDE